MYHVEASPTPIIFPIIHIQPHSTHAVPPADFEHFKINKISYHITITLSVILPYKVSHCL